MAHQEIVKLNFTHFNSSIPAQNLNENEFLHHIIQIYNRFAVKKDANWQLVYQFQDDTPKIRMSTFQMDSSNYIFLPKQDIGHFIDNVEQFLKKYPSIQWQYDYNIDG
ncbi:MAG: hypothetical protein ACOYVK_19010 [Bacillota bacterium]